MKVIEKNNFIRRHSIDRPINPKYSIGRNQGSRTISIFIFATLIVILLVTTILVSSYFLLIDETYANVSSTSKMPCEGFHNIQTMSSEELIQKENELHSKQYLSIYLLTYNVNGKEPEESLKDLFAFYHRLYDVYIVVLEELPVKSLMWIDNWTYELEQMFMRIGYVLLKKESAMLTKMLLFVRKCDLIKFSGVRSHSVKLVNGLSFKGGVGIRFIYNSIKVAFLGCHLTPHDDNYSQRIKNYRYLMSEINFGNQVEKIHNQDISFIFGDLNFRLNPLNITHEDDEFEYIVRFVKTHENDKNVQRYEPLLKYDQIRYAILNHEAFHDYKESPIAFPPTFKFVIGTCEYDDKRRPAWADRILSKNLLKLQFERNNPESTKDIDLIMMYYDSIPKYTLSDHKPVRQVAWIPVVQMKNVKRDLIKQRNSQKSFDLNFKMKLDSFNTRSLKTITSPSPSASSSSNLSDSQDWNPEIESSFWPNVDDPNLFQPQYSIEFYHIPNWNETRKFYANFRIVEENEDGTRQAVSINSSTIKGFLSVWDWVGLFPEQFSSLSDFVTFSYPKFGSTIQAEEAHDALSFLMAPSSPPDDENLRDGDDLDDVGNGDQRDEQIMTPKMSLQEPIDETSSSTSSTTVTVNDSLENTTEDVLTVNFDEDSPILAGNYVLIYVRVNGDVIGISNPFHIENDIDLSSAF